VSRRKNVGSVHSPECLQDCTQQVVERRILARRVSVYIENGEVRSLSRYAGVR